MDSVLKRLKEQNIGSIAIMGGTFDPVHYGHLIAAETVRVQFGIDRVLFIPSGAPPHKKNVSITLSDHRYTMVQMATVTNPFFEVSRMEIDREGYSYTIDTIKELHLYLKNDLAIYFITGADALLEILTWKNVSELLSICKFVAVTRPGFEMRALQEKVKELKEMFNSDIITISIPEFGISSTEIRNRAAAGLSIKYLVPECIEEYIKKNKLYKTYNGEEL